jgi:hypothetical protein
LAVTSISTNLPRFRLFYHKIQLVQSSAEVRVAESGMERITPLVEALSRFCVGNETADGGAPSAAALIDFLSDAWPDIPAVDVVKGSSEEMGRDEIVLAVVRDVGELAGLLLLTANPARTLGWARANLLIDLGLYLTLVGQNPDGTSEAPPGTGVSRY